MPAKPYNYAHRAVRRSWETRVAAGEVAAAPFLSIETPQGNVEMWALGEDRFRITAAGREQLVTGFDKAERTADALAEWLG